MYLLTTMPATAPLLRSVPYFGSPPGPLIPQSGMGQPLLVAAALRSAPSASGLGVSKLLYVSGKHGQWKRKAGEKGEEEEASWKMTHASPSPVVPGRKSRMIILLAERYCGGNRLDVG